MLRPYLAEQPLNARKSTMRWTTRRSRSRSILIRPHCPPLRGRWRRKSSKRKKPISPPTWTISRKTRPSKNWKKKLDLPKNIASPWRGKSQPLERRHRALATVGLLQRLSSKAASTTLFLANQKLTKRSPSRKKKKRKKRSLKKPRRRPKRFSMLRLGATAPWMGGLKSALQRGLRLIRSARRVRLSILGAVSVDAAAGVGDAFVSTNRRTFR